MSNLRYVIIFVLIVVMAGCLESNRESSIATGNRTVVHPTAENIPDDDSLSALIKKNEQLQLRDESNLNDRLSYLTEIIDIGTMEGEHYEMFGKIEKVLYYKEGIYILDSGQHDIKQFDISGRYLNTIGKAGRGPGEFIYVEDMFMDNNFLYVLDRYTKVDIFEDVDQEGQFEYIDSFFIEGRATNFCRLDSNVVVPNISNERDSYITIYDENGTIKQTVGDLYKSENERVRTGLLLGLVLCSEVDDLIVSAFMYFPFIYAYSTQGDLKWVSRIDEFEIQEIIEKDQGNTLSYTLPSRKPHHLFENLIPITSEYALAQIGYRNSNSPLNSSVMDSYLISVKTGEGKYLTSELPFISSISDSLIFAVNHEPFPRIRVFSF